jgi:hypothetical protein
MSTPAETSDAEIVRRRIGLAVVPLHLRVELLCEPNHLLERHAIRVRREDVSFEPIGDAFSCDATQRARKP